MNLSDAAAVLEARVRDRVDARAEAGATVTLAMAARLLRVSLRKAERYARAGALGRCVHRGHGRPRLFPRADVEKMAALSTERRRK